MRVFLHEFITSGALASESLPTSLLREGQAMHDAVAEDLLSLPGVEVVTTRDARIPLRERTGLVECVVSDSASELSRFQLQCGSCDRCLIIAPEIGGELERRVVLARDLIGAERLLNSPSLIPDASDKWETWRRLREAGVPAIETRPGDSDEWRAWGNVVVKPRDGAGSQGVRRLRPGDPPLDHGVIVQPFVRGRWLSCTVMFSPGRAPEAFPPAEQHIADDGSFMYLGGVMRADCDVAKVQGLALRAIQGVAGDLERLVGPVGVDFVELESTRELLVCEINPRFTTSFVAARALAQGSLLAALFDPAAPPIRWNSGRVAFNSAGIVGAMTS